MGENRLRIELAVLHVRLVVIGIVRPRKRAVQPQILVELVAQRRFIDVEMVGIGVIHQFVLVGPAMPCHAPRPFVGAVIVNLNGMIVAGVAVAVIRIDAQLAVEALGAARRERRPDLVAEGDLPAGESLQCLTALGQGK